MFLCLFSGFGSFHPSNLRWFVCIRTISRLPLFHSPNREHGELNNINEALTINVMRQTTHTKKLNAQQRFKTPVSYTQDISGTAKVMQRNHDVHVLQIAKLPKQAFSDMLYKMTCVPNSGLMWWLLRLNHAVPTVLLRECVGKLCEIFQRISTFVVGNLFVFT